LIAETAIWKGQCIYNCFIDFTKAFDTVGHHLTWAVLHSYGVDDKLVRVKKQAYLQGKSTVRLGKDMGTCVGG